MAVTADINWDGVTYPYMPGETLDIDPSLKLFKGAAHSVDPVTHEVLRHALWNVNLEHGKTVLRMSGSPIAAYGHDFNPAILDEEGNFVFFGPFLQYLAAATSASVEVVLRASTEM